MWSQMDNTSSVRVWEESSVCGTPSQGTVSLQYTGNGEYRDRISTAEI